MSDLSFKPDEAEIERRVEALLFAAAGPLSAADLAQRLPPQTDVGAALMALKARYAGRGPRPQAAKRSGSGSALSVRPAPRRPLPRWSA